MERETAKFIVEVTLDPIPGAFHTNADAENWIQMALDRTIGHYDPKVTPIEE